MTTTSASTDAGPTASDFDSVLRARLPTLTRTAQAIANTILADPPAVIHMTVTDLAEASETSLASVVRFCKDMGYKGFADLKINLARHALPAQQAIHEDVNPTDSSDTVLRKIVRSTADAVHTALATVDSGSFDEAVEVLASTRRLLIAGVGTSWPIVQDAAYRFRTAGLLTEAPIDSHGQHVSASLLTNEDTCLAISHTGQTRETIMTLTAAKEAGAHTIALTSFYRSPITALADINLIAGSKETNYRIEAMSSRIVHTTVLDALFVAVSLRNPDVSTTAQTKTLKAVASHRL
ncbi:MULTISPECIES: MurR/RpiR family transcriptional regulator [Rhodococcus]|uniref:MurR/RpiR family transcriptional regulator n=1 Tax=Rhodococcus baikonurensis TaxID=172041 RepID=A0ABV5XFN5_9NOCA|nr:MULTISPECIES: MurR/RpiR family transcriptional regulator [Rhodococcus]KLN71524.1 RpiR family transcriptional regulator [Rhodococcus erythropolis]KSU65014.1 RpiR family transcriptional regulator [Rhodococcus qingshengii]KZF17866.1 RpiR family transcriptional regulator [Rhodococcus sp. EPR-134]MDJ0441498.1 MurR/RpiR family transcriptional regulator [Rhodococcus qingshengii]SCC70185.1 transcriptional regulator, RpiR family [Rhodococcus qingshengii]